MNTGKKILGWYAADTTVCPACKKIFTNRPQDIMTDMTHKMIWCPYCHIEIILKDKTKLGIEEE